MNTPIAIVAHPQRYKFAAELADRVDAEAISLDDKEIGCSKNHWRAWTWLSESEGDWACVMEDDAVVLPGFRDQLNLALAKAPGPIVSLYLGRGRPKGAQSMIAKAMAQNPEAPTDFHWIASTYLLHGVAVAMKSDLIPDLLKYVKTRSNSLPPDETITDFAKKKKILIHYTRPSLADHRDMPTLMEVHPTKYPETDHSRTEMRKAWMWGKRVAWGSSTIFMDSL